MLTRTAPALLGGERLHSTDSTDSTDELCRVDSHAGTCSVEERHYHWSEGRVGSEISPLVEADR